MIPRPERTPGRHRAYEPKMEHVSAVPRCIPMARIAFHPSPCRFFPPRRLGSKSAAFALLLMFAAILSGCDSRPPLEDLGELEFSVPNLPGMGEPFVLPNGEKVTPRTEEDEMREAMMRQNPNLPVPAQKEPTADGPAAGSEPSAVPAAAPSQNGSSGDSHARSEADSGT